MNILYKKILVPLDGSELAQLALPFAEKIAGHLGSRIMLLYVCESLEDSRDPEHRLYLQKMTKVAKADIEQYMDKLKRKRIKVESEILVGDPASEIVDYAQKEDFSLIVMSTHGHSGIKRWALGSVADRVLRGTQKPLVLVRAKQVSPDTTVASIFKNIVVTLDGSRESEAVIPYIEELAGGVGAKVVLLHVIEPSYRFFTAGGFKYEGYSEKKKKSMKAFYDNYLEGIAAGLGRRGIDARFQVKFGEVAEAIIKFADEAEADFIAMTTHGRSGIKRWALGSTADKVLQSGNTSLFLVKTPAAKNE
jgi:nucleotide-binding universal stress UspA family protein